MSHDSDLDQVTKIIIDAVERHTDASELKKPLVGISGFGESSVDIEVRVWVDSAKYNSARFALNKMIWNVLKEAKILISFPQRVVSLLKPV